MEKRSPIDFKGSLTIEETEEDEKKKIEETIQKWLLLQKTVKEEITLEEIIINQQKEDYSKIKGYYKEYYDLKIKSRKIYEDIRKLKTYEERKNTENKENKENKQNKDYKEYYVEDAIDAVFLQACEAIKNLLFTFRNNYDYTLQLISLIDSYADQMDVESLVELLCNQFYENILIPNPENEELLILIYKLLEKEIANMTTASINEFLDDSTFLGKFISSFSKRQELNFFLSLLLNPLITSIENENNGCLDMSLFSIQNYVKKTKGEEIRQSIRNTKKSLSETFNEDDLLKNIPKANIHFKKNLQIEAEKAEKNRKDCITESILLVPNFQSSSNMDLSKKEYNREYLEPLTQDILYKKLKETDNKDLRDFYEHQLEQINTDPYIFSNESLFDVLREQCFDSNKLEIIKKYKENFLFIQEKVDIIIQSLIDKITSIPYTVRCISKMISILISKKFPLLSKYLQNSFIGKFIFNKCLFPVLNLENKNVIENIIFSLETKKCLHDIISILSTANKSLLFNCNTDTEKTIFNYYLLEIIPILNKFYEKLTEIELPKTLNDIISKTKDTLEQNLDNKIFSFIKKEEPTPDGSKIVGSPTPSYDYFSENSDEILKVQCICFSTSDIIFIMSLINDSDNKNLSKFQGLPNFESFKKTIEKIQGEEHKIDSNLKKEEDKRKFFIILKDEKNSQLEKLFRQKNKKIDEKNYPKSSLLCLKIKDCIKKILKGLNVLNIKDYSYLNMATSNEKFLLAIKYTLEDLLEICEVETKIPLNWYAQFIEKYKKNLDISYLENDLEKLYQELYNEEINTLNELKSFSSIIITRDGMNLRCAETILEKIKSDRRAMEKAKTFQKIENFIEKDKTKVCIKIREKDDGKVEKEKGGLKGLFGGKKEKETKVDQFQFVSIIDTENCPHKNMAFMASLDGERNKKFNSHAENINEFILKFSHAKQENQLTLMKYITEDIKSGESTHQLYKAFSEYMELLKKSIIKSKKYIESNDEKGKENELQEFTNKIEEHIMIKIYKYVFPKEQLEMDIKFYEKTKLLNWITPENLDIQNLYEKQLEPALISLKKMDRAPSVFAKINCLNEAHKNINNNIKFSSGKNENAGTDDLTPIFQYIVIKAHPKRAFSNINYIKCFLNKTQGQSNFLLSLLESAIHFILNIQPDCLNKINKEEFDQNINKAKIKLEEKKKLKELTN